MLLSIRQPQQKQDMVAAVKEEKTKTLPTKQ